MAETSERRVQVVMSWGGTPQGIVAVKAGGRVVIGESRATFLVPAELVPEPFPLIESDGAGGFTLRAPEGATLRAERDGMELAASNETGVRTVVIDPQLRAEVQLGAFAFFVQELDASTEKTPLTRPDFASWRWAGVSLVAHAAFLAALLFMPPNAGALSLDLTDSQREYVRIRLDAMEREREVLPPEAPATDPQGAMAGSATTGEAGTAGAVEETRSTGGGIRVRGESRDARVPLDRQTVMTAGALGTIRAFAGSFAAVTSPYGAEDALGFAQDDAYGDLMAVASGMSPGTGGLNMNGTGVGGGCLPGQPCAAGTIGQGVLGTGGFGTTCTSEEFLRIERAQGHAAAVASCQAGMRGNDIGSGHSPMGGRRPHGPPTLRCAPGPDGQCASVAAGGLSREDVRRVVTRNRAQVRHCYESALVQRPDLEGRLSIQWMIHQEGRVMGARVSGANELQNAEVERCVTQAVQRWQFPAANSPTAVTYPFVFQTQG